MTTDSLLKNSIIVMISLIISAIVLLLLSIVVARSITVAEFGMYAILISTQGLVSIFSQFGTASTLTKFVSEYRVRDKDISLQIARFGTVIVLSLTALSMVIYVALSEVIGIRIFNEPRLVTLIPISALAIFSSSLITVCI